MRWPARLGVLVTMIACGCFEDTTTQPTSSATSSGPDETVGPATSDDATTTAGGPTTDPDGTATTADDTAGTETGEQPPPMCGDGTPVPGELCYEDTSVVMANGAPASARLGDVTSNAPLDLVYLAMDQVVVHAGDGDGNFGAEIFDAAVTGQRFELADFDGDGTLDMAALETGGPLRLLVGSGAASFSSSDQVVVGGDPRTLAVGDLDGDGAMDAVVGTAASGLVFVVLGGGDGTLAPQPAVPVPGQTHGLALADLDDDGNLDVAMALQGGQPGVSVAWGDGNGGLAAPEATPGTTDGTRDVASGDFDGDGNQDLAFVSDAVDVLGVLLGDGAGGFGAAELVPTGSGPSVLLTADLRGDGRDELVVGHEGETTLRIFAVEGGAPTEIGQVMLVASTSALHAGDINDDGVLDLAATNTDTEIVTVVLSTP